MPIHLTPIGSNTRLEIRVMPRAPRARLDSVRDGRLIVRVTAAPVDDAANDAVIHLLAETLSLPRSAVRIIAGRTRRNKTIEIVAAAVVVRERLELTLKTQG
jgi:uncharacterized protein YggU (UPF0235/DUF167 family)